ncbi:alpha-L-arabinofuranosidase C-terminal domain-containing protein [Streptomyces sp. ME19-01-6]|uniref:alpha-L-arabinofuranosidase C-terminal domain-containing protein n=1 Tax=Streptomyces sp. ME19-01-6 TaxID=3028686 RepID=UPI0029B8FCB7|nr:alpha-L-arabinofuranosidase C-terminal domain-containing protein [Streptomyces sp. ME19-01-6]MDX3224936.1 alpha-L-arabinofuranosidase C-terminal domain-containing protein [Streptomyces sp. ME19-01-6]
MTESTEPVETVVEVDARAPGTAISSDLFGVFFEDINYAADGGLYAELVQNRSFAYSSADRPEWHALTAWELLERDGAVGSVAVSTDAPLDEASPHHAVLRTTAVRAAGRGAGLRNEGFDGIAVRAGERYDVSLFARLADGTADRLVARIESPDGSRVHGQAELGPLHGSWQRHTAVITCEGTDQDARFAVVASGVGTVHLDLVSLFPQATLRGRPGGLRADLAQAIADLKPKFVRFPGGCVAHGLGLANMYRWPATIGPLQARRQLPNLWGYHQSMGLGYYEYFQFCEDIGAKPLPVVPAGVCCQNTRVTGQVGLPQEEMPGYIAEVLALVEWANGPADSPWGALRAAAGHPEPFGLEYLGVGNEDTITDTFRDRFSRIHDALSEHHPEITVVGTVGPSPCGEEWEKGWAFARERGVPVVDEHSYKSPRWFLENTRRFDTMDRQGPHLYIGEYGSWGNDGRSAVAEAAYMIAMERNGDVVRLASYAPLLAKRGHTQWAPDLIYFDNTHVWPTVNYHVQRMHSVNFGDTALPVTVAGAPQAPPVPDAARHGVHIGTSADTRAEFTDARIGPLGAEPAPVPDFAGWDTESGTWEPDGAGGIRQTANGSGARLLLADAVDGTSYAFSARARKIGGGEGFVIGFAVTSPGDWYQWSVGGWQNRWTRLQRVDDGVPHDLNDPVAVPVETGRWYDLRVEVDGRRIRCYCDGELIHDIEDAPATPEVFAISAVRDSSAGDVIIKVANSTPEPVTVRIRLAGVDGDAGFARTTLAVTPDATSRFEPAPAAPVEDRLPGPVCDIPPHSFTVLRTRPGSDQP